MDKIKVNIVYSPQKEAPQKLYESERGEVWISPERNSGMNNIGMGWYSIRDPNPEDCLLAIEPYCVLDMDYDPNFASRFRKVFTWTPQAFKHPSLANKVVEINHPSCRNPPDEKSLVDSWPKWNERANEIIFIANNKSSSHDSELYSLRIKLADLLYQNSRFKVKWYGQSSIRKPYYAGSINSKYEVLRKAKFSVCTENCYDPIYSHNYFTEKMPEVLFSGAVPIYMGCYNIDDFNFNPHSYIDLRTYVKKDGKRFDIDLNSLIQRIEGFDSQRYDNFRKDIFHDITKPNGLYHIISFNRMYEVMIDSLAKT